MKVAQLLSIATVACCMLSLVTSVHGLEMAPSNCGKPGALSESTDWNARIEVACSSNTERSFASAKFLADVDSLTYYMVYIKFNCSNETHYEVSPSFRILYTVGHTAETDINLSGNIECTTFGCYEVTIFGSTTYPRHNFAAGNASMEGVCSIDLTPSDSSTVSSSIHASLTVTSMHPSLILTSIQPTVTVTSSASVMNTTTMKSINILGEHSTTFPPTATIIEITQVPFSSSNNQQIVVLASALSQASNSSSLINRLQVTEAAHSDVGLKPWELMLVAPAFIIIIFCITLVLCTVVAQKRWRKNRLLTNLRTGYGLQKHDHQSKEVYEHIADTLLDIAFSEGRDKYVSTDTIVDLFNYTVTVEMSSGTTYNDVDSIVESDIQHTLAAPVNLGGYSSSSESDQDMLGYIRTMSADPPPPYIPSLVYNDTECMTQHNATHTIQADNSQLASQGGYIPALTYTTHQVVNVERDNAVSNSVHNSTSYTIHDYVVMAPKQQAAAACLHSDTDSALTELADTRCQSNDQGYVANM